MHLFGRFLAGSEPSQSSISGPRSIRFPKISAPVLEEIIRAPDAKKLELELSELPENQRLVAEKEFEVYYASAEQIPMMMFLH
jgi:hypothetical protein